MAISKSTADTINKRNYVNDICTGALNGAIKLLEDCDESAVSKGQAISIVRLVRDRLTSEYFDGHDAVAQLAGDAEVPHG